MNCTKDQRIKKTFNWVIQNVFNKFNRIKIKLISFKAYRFKCKFDSHENL